MRLRERRRLCRLFICSGIFFLTVYSIFAQIFGISFFSSLFHALFGSSDEHRIRDEVHSLNDNLRQSLSRQHEQYITLFRQATNTENRRFTRLHVVEEHHEVVPLWLRRFVEPTFSDLSEPILPLGQTVLVHVDAHADLANPDLNTFLYPKKRLPLTMRELTALIQRNDQFIMPLAALNVFSDIIWIYPGWIEDERNFHEAVLNIGIYHSSSSLSSLSSSSSSLSSSLSSDTTNSHSTAPIYDNSKQYLCVCVKKHELSSLSGILSRTQRPSPMYHSSSNASTNAPPPVSSDTNDLSCSYTSPDNDLDVVIPVEQCHIHGSTRFTVIKDLYVITFMHLIEKMVKSGTFSDHNLDSILSPHDSMAYKTSVFRVLKILHPYISKSSLYQRSIDDELRTTTPLPYILDIDEDFFGVQFPGWPLNRTGVNIVKQVHTLNDALGKVFCSFDGANTEKLFQMWLHEKIIGNLFLHKWRCWHRSEPPVEECTNFDAAYPLMSESLFEQKKYKMLLCSATWTAQNVNVKAVFKHLWEFLHPRSQIQLQVIIQMGVCMQESASVSRMVRLAMEREALNHDVSNFGLGLCCGSNEPGSKIVAEHLPTEEKLNERMRHLETMFSQLRSPALVTVCRSSRDGYVPRKWQSRIERKLLETLVRLKFIRDDLSQDVTYDRDLWTPYSTDNQQMVH